MEKPTEQSGRSTDINVQSELSGSAEQVVQARDVRGGVHFHSARHRSGFLPYQLPGDVPGFVNRTDDLAKVDNAWLKSITFRTAATIVITGTAGVGKTSLAVHWGHLMRERFPDGQLYINLRGYDPGAPVTSSEALDRFLRALDVPAAAIPSDIEARAALYRSLLAGRRTLIVLDNAVGVSQVRFLLPNTPECLVLVTSRSRLSGLVARNGAHRVSLDLLSQEQSIELLRATIADYRTGDSADDLNELARLCGRLPLALRIAAERAASRPQMPLIDLIHSLRDESELWEALSAENDDEADAVRTVFAWSYRALPDKVARLFRILGLYPGDDFGSQAAAALLGEPATQVRYLLDTLVGAHLLMQTASDRYRFHDLLKAFASDQVRRQEPLEEQRAALRRLFTWYVHTAATAPKSPSLFVRTPPLLRDPDNNVQISPLTEPSKAVDWYKLEWGNIEAAMHAAVSFELHEVAWKLCLAGYRLSQNYRSYEEVFALLSAGFDAARSDGDKYGEAEIINARGIVLEWNYHRLDDALASYQSALEIRREIGDETGEAIALSYIASLHSRRYQFPEAEELFEQVIAIFARTDDHQREIQMRRNLARVVLNLGRVADAAELTRNILTIDRENRYHLGELSSLRLLSRIDLDLGRFGEAFAFAEEVVTKARSLNSPIVEGAGLNLLGEAQRGLERYDDALISYHRSTIINRQVGIRNEEAEAYNGAGCAYCRLGRLDEASAFHHHAITIIRDLRDPWQLAVSLSYLATAEQEAGHNDEAQEHRREALSLLNEFTHSKALEMRSNLERLLHEDGNKRKLAE